MMSFEEFIERAEKILSRWQRRCYRDTRRKNNPRSRAWYIEKMKLIRHYRHRYIEKRKNAEFDRRNPPRQLTKAEKLERAIRRAGEDLADQARVNFDEHGYSRGDYRQTEVLEYLWPHEAKEHPYLDSGGAGLALIEIMRKRVYAASCDWWPKKTFARYLIGRNEAGTYFCHPVSKKCHSVYEALRWIWQDREDRIILRQGDIALIEGPRQKEIKLPPGHRIEGDFIVHDTHPPMRLPQKGERIIIGRRATDHVSQGTRD